MDSEQELKAEAVRLWKRAYRLQQDGAHEQAIAFYRRSLEVHPTAEALTFLGWVLSYEGNLEESIDYCLQAIEVDPDFGNPYNDIGCYYMQQGRLDEAVAWFERAKQASRYDSPQYPFLNLGRIYMRQGLWQEAKLEFAQALQLAPSDLSARKALLGLIGRFN